MRVGFMFKDMQMTYVFWLWEYFRARYLDSCSGPYNLWKCVVTGTDCRYPRQDRAQRLLKKKETPGVFEPRLFGTRPCDNPRVQVPRSDPGYTAEPEGVRGC
jgi:hypothetical protein